MVNGWGNHFYPTGFAAVAILVIEARHDNFPTGLAHSVKRVTIVNLFRKGILPAHLDI